MLTAGDLVALDYTADLTQSGISYACRSLSFTYDRMGGSSIDRVRRIVAGIAVELALRRHLGKLGVPFDILGATPFTDPDRYDIALGGRRCDLKSFILNRKDLIRQVRAEPSLLLDAQALVPVDQASSLRDEDLYLFCFLNALVTGSAEELESALQAGQPVFLMHALPERWSRPPHWDSLGALVLKSEMSAPVEIEIGGQDAQRNFQSLKMQLPGGKRVRLPEGWHSIAYLAVDRRVEARVGLYSASLDETYLVSPEDWGNVWVYGMEIVLAGYMTRGEFRRRSRLLPAGSSVFQYRRTRTDNYSLPVRELHAPADLFVRARNWAQEHKK